jgi:hypothetical protein
VKKITSGNRAKEIDSENETNSEIEETENAANTIQSNATDAKQKAIAGTATSVSSEQLTSYKSVWK